jgi:hypothetical protein
VAIPPDTTVCVDPRWLGPKYTYLLGLYLGDGMITLAPRWVFRLRIVLDLKYPGIIERCADAMKDVSGLAAGTAKKVGCVELYGNWKHWVCAFPQHGPGPKHKRSIVLATWQQELVRAWPGFFVAGLIDSDGCRVMNQVQKRKYSYPRYMFSNTSPEIRAMFGMACDLLGVKWRQANACNLSVARRESVAILDRHVGPKR